MHTTDFKPELTSHFVKTSIYFNENIMLINPLNYLIILENKRDNCTNFTTSTYN